MNTQSDPGYVRTPFVTASYSETDGHVHFKTEDVSTHESEIVVVPLEEGIQQIHLGFLQIRHVYTVTFPLPHSLGKDVTYDPLENLLVKVKEMTPIDNGEL